jgi:hypothetical protein
MSSARTSWVSASETTWLMAGHQGINSICAGGAGTALDNPVPLNMRPLAAARGVVGKSEIAFSRR